jgi:hypothetical protein
MFLKVKIALKIESLIGFGQIEVFFPWSYLVFVPGINSEWNFRKFLT